MTDDDRDSARLGATIAEDHRRLVALMEEVAAADAVSRPVAFSAMAEHLVRHEVAEEKIVYPALRRAEDGDPLARARLLEQAEAETRLSELERFRSDTTEFLTGFEQLQKSVVEHAALEESQVLPLLEAGMSADESRELARRYARARSSGPTHPHPAAPDTPPGNVLAVPVAALYDRVRDALHRA